MVARSDQSVSDQSSPDQLKSGQFRSEQVRALSLSTCACTVCFAAWTIFSIIGVKIKADLLLNDTQFGLLVATPVLTGSLSRLSDLTGDWLGGNWQASNREFEILLSDLRAGDGGALLAAHSLVSLQLERANTLLASTQSTAPLCPFGNPTDRSRAMEQVVARFFVGAVQPWLVRLRHRAELLLAPVTNLEAPLSAELSPQYRAWVVKRDHLLTNQTQLIRAHIASIQATLAPCGPY